jgi:homoserine O-acetyltransferase
MKKVQNRALGACLAIGLGLGAGIGVGSARADTAGEAPHQRFELGDFRLETGR